MKLSFIVPANAPELSKPENGPYIASNGDGQVYAVCGDVWCMVDAGDYFTNPRAASVSYWTGGRECEEPREVEFDSDNASIVGALAFPDTYIPGLCKANDEYAMNVLRPLAVDGWHLQPTDHRGANNGGAELFRFRGNEGSCDVLYLTVDDESGQWTFYYWTDDTRMAREDVTFAAAEYGCELDPEDAQKLAREFLSQPAITEA